MAQQHPPLHDPSRSLSPTNFSSQGGASGADAVEGVVRITLPKNLNGGVLVAQFHAFYGEVLAMAKKVEQSGAQEGEQGGIDDWGSASQADQWGGAGGDLSADPSQAISPAPAPASGGGPAMPPALAANLASNGQPAEPDSATQGGGNSIGAVQPAVAPRRHRKEHWPVLVDEMVRRLAHLLDLGGDQAIRLGGAYGATLYDEAKYAMAALADEVFLHQVRWAGADAWGDNLLETHLFHSAISGERLFQNIDAMLADSSPAHTELASIYLMVLTLGFRGRYRGRSSAEIDSYRARLRVFIAHRIAPVQDGEPVFADAYRHTLDEGRETLLPAIARWVWVAMGALVLYLIVSEALWVWLTDPVYYLIRGG